MSHRLPSKTLNLEATVKNATHRAINKRESHISWYEIHTLTEHQAFAVEFPISLEPTQILLGNSLKALK